MTARLSRAALAASTRRGSDLPEWARRCGPPPPALGVLHLGPGAFHRAHQAWYFDRALDDDPRWGISALAVHSAAVVDALREQDGLYTLATLDAQPDLRLVRAHGEWLCAARPQDRGIALRRCADPALQLMTLTVTEKGYCLRPDGTLDLAHPDIVADLAAPSAPRSAIGWVVAALAARRTAGLPPLTVISCDNRSGNGGRLRDAVHALADRIDASLAAWIRAESCFPDSMVDTITPATTPELCRHVAAQLGLDDVVPVQREAFCQWVIEDRFCSQRPDFPALGVTLTDDVARHERAKLRILNGAHSTLAYIGLGRGHVTVLDAMQDEDLERHVRRMLDTEVLPGMQPGLERYAAATLARFGNRALRHELAQIAWDGSQKLPYRIVETVTENLAAGRPIGRLACTLAAWLLFLRRAAAEQRRVVDPLADELQALCSRTSGDVEQDVEVLLSLRALFTPELAQAPALRGALRRAYSTLLRGAPLSA